MDSNTIRFQRAMLCAMAVSMAICVVVFFWRGVAETRSLKNVFLDLSCNSEVVGVVYAKATTMSDAEDLMHSRHELNQLNESRRINITTLAPTALMSRKVLERFIVVGVQCNGEMAGRWMKVIEVDNVAVESGALHLECPCDGTESHGWRLTK